MVFATGGVGSWAARRRGETAPATIDRATAWARIRTGRMEASYGGRGKGKVLLFYPRAACGVKPRIDARAWGFWIAGPASLGGKLLLALTRCERQRKTAAFQSARAHEPTTPSRSIRRTECAAEVDRPFRCAVSGDRIAHAQRSAFRERRWTLGTRLRLSSKVPHLHRGRQCLSPISIPRRDQICAPDRRSS